MRSLLLLSAIAAITACSDSGQTTNPAGASQAASAASNQRSPSNVAAFAKSNGGLTISVVIGPTVDIAPGGSSSSVATCPAGSAVTGGGYEYFNLGTEPTVYRNREALSQPGVASGWTVSARNTQAGAQTVSLTAWVSCAS